MNIKHFGGGIGDGCDPKNQPDEPNASCDVKYILPADVGDNHWPNCLLPLSLSLLLSSSRGKKKERKKRKKEEKRKGK
jgi:hypothetical protein